MGLVLSLLPWMQDVACGVATILRPWRKAEGTAQMLALTMLGCWHWLISPTLSGPAATHFQTSHFVKRINPHYFKPLLVGFSATSTKMIPNWYTKDTRLCYVCYLLPLQVDQKLFLLKSQIAGSLLSFPFITRPPTCPPITHSVLCCVSPSVV